MNSQFHRSLKRNGFCCAQGFFLEYENVDAEYVADLLDIAMSTVFYQKRKFRNGDFIVLCNQSAHCMAKSLPKDAGSS